MHKMDSVRDDKFMSIALEAAVKALEDDNFPCGAVLTINDELIATSRNEKETKADRISHAEMNLYIQHSATIKSAKKRGNFATMYTTLEPCLMCFGTAVMHRVDRIVVSLPDPLGNMSKLDGKTLGTFYDGTMPKLEYGLLANDSYALIKKYLLDLDTQESHDYIKKFEGTINNFTK